MAIVVSYGSFSFPAGEPTVSENRDRSFADNGDILKEHVRVDIEGKYSGSSPAAYEAQMLAMRAALDTIGASFTVSYGGTNTAGHISSGTACTMGPRCSSVSFPEGAGPELADGGCRTYRASIEWEYEPGTQFATDLLTFSESITFTQGDPIKQVVNTMNGTALVFTTCATPAYEATQSGEAVGRTSYPTAPALKWGTDYLIARDPIRRDSPEIKTINSSGSLTTQRIFKTSWNYTFAGAVAFAGTNPIPSTGWGTA